MRIIFDEITGFYGRPVITNVWVRLWAPLLATA
jgi:hypothetical protein